MTFFAFQPPPVIVGVVLVVLYLGPHVLPLVRGRLDGVGRALGFQVAIMFALYLAALLFAPNKPDILGVLLFALLFLPIALTASALIQLRNMIARRITEKDD